MADNNQLETDLDVLLEQLIAQGLPDIRDQGRSFRFGELLRQAGTLRKTLRASSAKIGAFWIGRVDD